MIFPRFGGHLETGEDGHMERRKKRKFSAEFKAGAVKLVLDEGRDRCRLAIVRPSTVARAPLSQQLTILSSDSSCTTVPFSQISGGMVLQRRLERTAAFFA